MNMNRNTAMIVTGITAACCGLPGCLSLCMGLMFALVGGIPGSNIDIGGSSDPAAAIGLGIAMLCVGLIAIVIPIVVGFVTLRNKPAMSDVPQVIDSDPLPPAA